MNQDLMTRYAGRAAGAAAAYYTIGKRLDTVGMLAAVALGWLGGGYLVDTYVAKVAPPQG
jgi:hypothetical protein